MGYYMRFVVTAEQPPDLAALETGLQSADAGYWLEVHEGANAPSADLRLGDQLCGEIEINRPGDGLFEEELEELVEFLDDAGEGDVDRVRQALDAARAIIAVRVLHQGRESDDSLEKIDALWQWLFQNSHGLLQADGEGYYDESGQILEVG